MEYANWFVVLMGIGVVFFGLIVIIIAVKIMGIICGGSGSIADSGMSAADSSKGIIGSGAPKSMDSGTAIKLEPGLVAGIAAVIAEEMGTDVKGIRIKSIKRV